MIYEPTTDTLEKDIRSLFDNTGPLDRDELTHLLLQLLERIQRLEAAHGIKEKNT